MIEIFPINGDPQNGWLLKKESKNENQVICSNQKSDAWHKMTLAWIQSKKHQKWT